ncbi:MAG: hypothetical protein L6R37_004544 [Teloschistes peruensis]|nr:MAG: hypothetical protein L6R37_004544 [Teloschistes peruensis]
MADDEDWSSNANEALHISFVQAGQTEPVILSTFHPKFTYPIFGDEECIFGYQGLVTKLRFAAHDLLPNLTVSYDKEFGPVDEVAPLDIKDALREWIPGITFQDPAKFDSHIQQDARKWEPPGELLESYTSRGRNFEIFSGPLTNPVIQQLVDRIQILVSFFIEGGTPIPLDDQDWSLARWRVFFIYEKLSSLPSSRTSPYSLVGYSTTYRFLPHESRSIDPQAPFKPHNFVLPPLDPFSLDSLPARDRISQFLILPSHQSHSHGTHLYNTIVRLFLADPTTTEITVEDPNEAFDDLRDYCDYARLTANGTFPKIHFPISSQQLDPKLFAKTRGTRVPTSKLLDLPLLSTLRHQNKIAPRQFARLVEMYLLVQFPISVRQSGTMRITRKARSSHEEDRKWYYWRLLLKQRIYKKNKDTLKQLDRVERVEKCEDTVGVQAGDYERLLRKMAEKGSTEAELNVTRDEVDELKGLLSNGGKGRRDRGKRKVLDDEDEELEGTPEPKRAREGGATR